MIKKHFWTWLPLAVSGTVILLAVYVAVQQSYRQAANDPQIELVENASAALNTGFPVQALFANATKLDINKTLSMFVMVFDDSGSLVAASVSDGAATSTATPPVPPKSLFENVRAHGQTRVTWQTASGLRFAAVVDKFKSDKASGYIMSARSLREVEVRENNLSWVILLAWLAFLVVSLAAVVVSDIMRPLTGVDLN